MKLIPHSTARALGVIIALFTVQARCTPPVALAIASASRVGTTANLTRHVLYQAADSSPHPRSHEGPWRPARRIPTTIPPKLGTPLAAWYREDQPGLETITLYYLDATGRIVLGTGHYDTATGETSSWIGMFVGRSTISVADTSSLAVLPMGADPMVTAHLYYLDRASFLVEQVGDTAKRIGPRALKGSKVAVAGPGGENGTEVYVFSVDVRGTLSRVRRGIGRTAWSPVEIIMPNFATPPQPDVHLAATAWWSDPFVARVLWIDTGSLPAELVSHGGGAWLRVPHESDDALPPIRAASVGMPIAVTVGTRHKAHQDYEFIEVFYMAAEPVGAITNLVKKPVLGWRVGDFVGTDRELLPGPGGDDDKLTLADRLSVSLTILFGIASFVTGVLAARAKWPPQAEMPKRERKDVGKDVEAALEIH